MILLIILNAFMAGMNFTLFIKEENKYRLFNLLSCLISLSICFWLMPKI